MSSVIFYIPFPGTLSLYLYLSVLPRFLSSFCGISGKIRYIHCAYPVQLLLPNTDNSYIVRRLHLPQRVVMARLSLTFQ
ncbi:hypothetical protein ACISK3_02845 [Morganella morganii]|nr:hypothetical protein [Morganella morganii]